ncbi:alpha/beta hydrolase [Fusobacterium polymorphum]|mgnify:FL=1|uniref:Alpha/beta hydrolase n=2 Tax=Fusobacterium TaxID=848 RepID=A0A323U9M2_FUSNU|nr:MULTISPECIES: alpha/beta hydrolase [Fusobacterium]ASC02779.1 alpha/beta hydrolase [Fusobacterium polymorphum]EUB29762.1 alpha/beta hydrolase family protein [Fusobacterium sp. OBRC1]PCR84248.1 alpha/beta hydrolase [Fusobacterium nucleatum]PHI17128.1 alpha/beta hydrolase [Fusobacterium polymorphum]PZA04478.1 alpha/beta hydrolase [Fusobacterium nucleatum]
MKNVVIYIHGKYGTVEEAEYYKKFFNEADIIGFEYTSEYPWDFQKEFSNFIDNIYIKYKKISIIANSIGAYFTMLSLTNKNIEKAFFISPIVDMEKLITDMMFLENITEEELYKKKKIKTSFGETVSWDYLTFARKNPIEWNIPTYILYGENDDLTSYETILNFTNKSKANLTIMKGGEHWFHTDEQIEFLNNWIKNLA